MRESEQLIRPLEEVFDRISVENLRSAGVKGVIQIELPIEELMASAERKGFVADGIPDPRKKDIGMYWVDPFGNPLVFYTKNGTNGKEVYILNEDLGRYKAIYFGNENN